MAQEAMGLRDKVVREVGYQRDTDPEVRIKGRVTIELFGPDGVLKHREEIDNLVTDKGDAHWALLAYTNAGQAATYGMKLGTATTAASKTYNNAGGYIAAADYVSGSAAAMDGTFPKVGASANIAQFKCTWAAGTATNATINRVSLCDNTTDAGETDGTHTWAISVFSGAVNKAAGDTLAVTWNVTFLGA